MGPTLLGEEVAVLGVETPSRTCAGTRGRGVTNTLVCECVRDSFGGPGDTLPKGPLKIPVSPSFR